LSRCSESLVESLLDGDAARSLEQHRVTRLRVMADELAGLFGRIENNAALSDIPAFMASSTMKRQRRVCQ